MVFNVNKQWVLHNCDPESMLNKYDLLFSDYALSRLQTLVVSVKENHLIFVYTVVLR